MQQSGTCPKCGSTDLTEVAKTRTIGVGMITCRQCRYVELYAESSEQIKNTRLTIVFIYLVCALIVGALIMIPMLLNWLTE